MATIGREGMAGLTLFLGGALPTERVLVQVPGAALRLSAAQFLQAGLPQLAGTRVS